MRIAEQLSDDDLGEPPSPEPHENYFDLLFDAHDRLKMYPPYPSVSSRTGEFTALLIDDYENLEIEASLSGRLAERYRQLDHDNDGRYELAECIERAIGRTAVSVFGTAAKDAYEDDTIALINHLPVLFEPLNHAMLVGKWQDDRVRERMHITSKYVESYNQQRLLLGGLAALVTYLEQQ